MSFSLPSYKAPDFSQRPLRDCPAVVFGKVQKAGVPPENYHATSIYPEYFHVRDGDWQLLEESRMDCVVVLEKKAPWPSRRSATFGRGEHVACGRMENGEDGIYVHTKGFDDRDRSKTSFRSDAA